MSAPTFRSRAPWVLVLIAATLPSLASSQTDAVTKKLTLEMYLDLESVSNPQISPDGARIVYTRGWVDKMNDRRESSIWIMNADGSKIISLLMVQARFGHLMEPALPILLGVSPRDRRSLSDGWMMRVQRLRLPV